MTALVSQINDRWATEAIIQQASCFPGASQDFCHWFMPLIDIKVGCVWFTIELLKVLVFFKTQKWLNNNKRIIRRAGYLMNERWIIPPAFKESTKVSESLFSKVNKKRCNGPFLGSAAPWRRRCTAGNIQRTKQSAVDGERCAGSLLYRVIL